MEQNGEYPAGTVLFFSQGEYSDYGYCGTVKLLKDINLQDVLTACKADWALRVHDRPEWRKDGDPDPQDFVAFLIASELAEDFDCREIHLGSYGRLEIT